MYECWPLACIFAEKRVDVTCSHLAYDFRLSPATAYVLEQCMHTYEWYSSILTTQTICWQLC